MFYAFYGRKRPSQCKYEMKLFKAGWNSGQYKTQQQKFNFPSVNWWYKIWADVCTPPFLADDVGFRADICPPSAAPQVVGSSAGGTNLWGPAHCVTKAKPTHSTYNILTFIIAEWSWNNGGIPEQFRTREYVQYSWCNNPDWMLFVKSRALLRAVVELRNSKDI